MTTLNRRMLEKATMTTGDFTGDASGGILTIEQIETFLRLAITRQSMLPDVRTVMANANKWQENKINFDSRILRAGTEGTRLVDADRIRGVHGTIEISTTLLRGEVPISDEVMEDQVEREGFGNTIMTMVAEAAGRDVEDLLINGDTSIASAGGGTIGDIGIGTAAAAAGNVSDRAYYEVLDGWLKQALSGAGANVINFATMGDDYQSLFTQMVVDMPDRYKRDKANMRFYVSDTLEEKYRDQLAQRGTVLGDKLLEGTQELKYQGIPIKGVPLMRINPGVVDTSADTVGTEGNHSFVLLTHRQNLYAGFRRQIRMETWRDPREGGTSFVVTTRVDAKVAHVPATVLAHNVNVAA